MALSKSLVQKVILSRPHRNMLRWGFEMQQDGPGHMTVTRLAKKAGVPASIVGSVCGVRGYDRDVDALELSHYLALVEVLLDV